MLRIGTLIVLLLALAPSLGHAQAPGIRGGFTDDPDSVFLGGHLAFQGVGNVSELRIEPALELGIGEVGRDVDFFSLRFGANAKYMFPLGGSGFSAYPLLGASIYYINFEDEFCGRFDDDCDDLEAGLQLGGGFEYEGFALDLYVGVFDIPDVTLALLYTF